ncbi:winged helix-turn-helix domain-containing protein [Saccharopolyspora erythraea]|uniref:BTAD domain-containing putative transcriptional regulator n=1 Tax=Saccharopolyspora erythraea TaxID=1836 RepID=UPI001BA7140A|nr:BTAD domain-containing putative transcriptional regulator [Saccharopolyspora erythraea]QUH04153.1 winged helix-turn-helix domain-containing protein [Saccharopolyspora erythraea]
MRFGVLGPLTVWDADGQDVRVPEAKVRTLLAILLVHRGGPVSADRLVDDVWADDPPGAPLNTLQSKVSQLRRVLGRDRVVHEPAGYRLRLDDAVVDALLFQELVERARATEESHTRAELFAEALALWRGAAYADVADAPFARSEITRLDELRLTAVEDHAETLLELGQHSALATKLAEVVPRHPLRERLRMAQMRALYRAGRQTEAMRSFHDLRRRLAEELGVNPGPEVAALHEAMLRQEPQLAAPVEAPRAHGRTNLPTPLTALIGRDEAIRQVHESLGGRPGARLVTLTGPGGVGKTRLAVTAAGELTERFPEGVWLVELAGLACTSTADDIAERIVVTLGLCDTAAAEPDSYDLMNWLCQTVADKTMVLLLDNCEHVLEPVATLAETLLAAVPGARLLLTSREPLDIPGEVVLPVPPLALPDDTTAGQLPAVARCSAVQLFVERAAAAVPGFTLDADNAEAVAVICRRLDGIPLALEIVAPRLRALSPARLAECLDDRFNLPTGPGRGRAVRQQTLRAMIDWSWELLSEAEKVVLRRLAVHADGCTLDAAETVCADGTIPAHRVLDLLSRLVDRSLVVRDGDRFRLLESVSAYCVERLAESGELATVRDRFVRCYTELAEHADRKLRGPEQRRYLERLDEETVNLRRALDTALREDDHGAALRLVNAMAWFWFLRGRLTEGRRSLRSALAAEGGSPAARAAARGWLAGIEVRTSPGDGVEVPDLAGIDDPALRARLQWFVGSALLGDGPHERGRRLVEDGLATARAHQDRWAEAVALVERAGYRANQDGMAPARADAERGAGSFHELRDRWGQLRASRSLALLAELDGNRARATRLHRDGLHVAEELSLWTEAVEALAWLGQTSLADGDTARATELYERALHISTERAYHRGEIRVRTELARIARQEGDLDRAARHLRRASARSRNLRHVAERSEALADAGPVERGDDIAPALVDDLSEDGLALQHNGFPPSPRP